MEPHSTQLTTESKGPTSVPVVQGVPVRTLDELAIAVQEGHQRAENALRTWLDSAVEIGRALMEARPQVPRGAWTEWCRDHGLSLASVSRYWRAAVHEEALRAVGATSGDSVDRVLSANSLRGVPRGESARVPEEKRAQALALVNEQGLAPYAAARLTGVSSSALYRWLDPERYRAQDQRNEERRRERQRKRYQEKAASREAELALQVRDAARSVGGDYEKAVEYMTKLDQILGRAREQASDSPDRRKAAIEAHKHRDRAMDALRRGLGL